MKGIIQNCLLLLGSYFLSGFIHGPHASTLTQIQKKGFLSCGVSQGLAGFSVPNKDKIWSGFDVDVCKAIASAIFKTSKNKVKFIPLSAKERFTALQSGEIDVLSRNTTLTMSRDTRLGLNFGPIVYYDGQGFLINKEHNISSAKELNGATVCCNAGTTTELNIADFFKKHNLNYRLLTFEKTDETLSAYEAKRCDVYSTDLSGIAAQKLRLSKPQDHASLQEIISKEPFAPVVRQGDPQWANIIRWTIYALIWAEENNIDSKNINNVAKKNLSPVIQRFLGTQGNLGKNIGLDKRWAYFIIKQVGNYGEIFNRNLGDDSPLKLSRGLNQIWEKGGLLYSPPFR